MVPVEEDQQQNKMIQYMIWDGIIYCAVVVFFVTNIPLFCRCLNASPPPPQPTNHPINNWFQTMEITIMIIKIIIKYNCRVMDGYKYIVYILFVCGLFLFSVVNGTYCTYCTSVQMWLYLDWFGRVSSNNNTHTPMPLFYWYFYFVNVKIRIVHEFTWGGVWVCVYLLVVTMTTTMTTRIQFQTNMPIFHFTPFHSISISSHCQDPNPPEMDIKEI